VQPTWKSALFDQFDLAYMEKLQEFLRAETADGKVIHPPAEEVFSAFNLTSLDKVKVVILGQDPYHGPGQAHGLSFSVKPGVKPPPSLVNIYKELNSDLKIPVPNHGFLRSWAEQGVLLLNSVLTVEDATAGSHQKRGWEDFTDRAVEILNQQCTNLVFILWGSYAQKKGAKIDPARHLVIESAHPSPLSAYRGFLGSRPFSRANKYLRAHGIEEIDWSLPQLTEHL
jgi:uracil-DNA glycosylase